MIYLAHTGHAQLTALWLSCVGWTLTAVALGLIQWRVWLGDDISSGMAWVGVWRVCFNSRTVVSLGLHCNYISLTEAFTPPEIKAGQVLMMLSILVGFCGNAGGVYALRNIYIGTEKTRTVQLSFFSAGALCLVAAVMSLIPLVWNLTSVVTNQTIAFPPEFKLPQAPHSQYVGSGIGVGMVGTILMIVSGIVFCMYRLPARPLLSTQLSRSKQVHVDVSSHALPMTDRQWGSDNPVFESHEHLSPRRSHSTLTMENIKVCRI